MQIVVVNQKTKSIRSRSFPADVGSQGTNNATAAEAAPMTTPRKISWKSEPLRTDFETYSTARPRAGVTCARRWVHPPGEEVLDGIRSEPAVDRGRRRACVCRQGRCDGPEHPHHRLDRAGRRRCRPRAVNHLLVLVGRPRLLHAPARLLRGRPTTGVADTAGAAAVC